MSKKVFIITGTGRSGSTLLDLMLGNDSKGFSVGEMYALFRPWRPHHMLRDRGCFCEDPSCNFWSDLKEQGEKDIYNNIFEKVGASFIVDSSKNPLWLKDQIKYSKDKEYQITPILIFKNPQEYAYSLYKRNKLEGWKKGWINTHKRLFTILDDFISVKYKELAKNPDSKLQSICKEVGISYQKGRKKFWKNQHEHFLFGSGTVRNSDHLVYYEDQYDTNKMNELKKKSSLHTAELENVMEVLEGFEVNSNQTPKKISSLKEKLGEFTLYEQIKLRSQATSHYLINRSVSKAKSGAKKILKGH